MFTLLVGEPTRFTSHATSTRAKQIFYAFVGVARREEVWGHQQTLSAATKLPSLS